MTKQADFKRRVRTRMAKTGESYATARAQVLSERPRISDATWATALHVTNGDCTVTELRATGLAHHIVCWRDALHDGPVPDVPADELRRIRARFLAGENAADLGTTEEFAERDRILEPMCELRFVAEAFDRLSREYPSTRDGLSLTERRILAAVAEGAPTAEAAFFRVGARETRPFLGDTWCFDAMTRLAQAPNPLLEAEPTANPVEPHSQLRLTDIGRRVLDGHEDHIALNGIDRCIGGVHLHGQELPWRWNEGTETITTHSS